MSRMSKRISIRKVKQFRTNVENELEKAYKEAENYTYEDLESNQERVEQLTGELRAINFILTYC